MDDPSGRTTLARLWTYIARSASLKVWKTPTLDQPSMSSAIPRQASATAPPKSPAVTIRGIGKAFAISV
jgi:hypothetical protein